MSKAISRRDFMKVTGVVGAAGLLAACGGNSSSTAASSSVASAGRIGDEFNFFHGTIILRMSFVSVCFLRPGIAG